MPLLDHVNGRSAIGFGSTYVRWPKWRLSPNQLAYRRSQVCRVNGDRGKRRPRCSKRHFACLLRAETSESRAARGFDDVACPPTLAAEAVRLEHGAGSRCAVRARMPAMEEDGELRTHRFVFG